MSQSRLLNDAPAELESEGEMTFCEPASAGSTVETPPEIFGPLHAEFGFHRDVCATPQNTKCPAFWSIEDGDDGLAQEWSGVLWCNPPYGKGIGAWVEKAYRAACDGYATVACLLPVRSDNEWWKWVLQAEVRFLRGRVVFHKDGKPMVGKDGKPQSCMFPVCVAIFHAHLDPGGVMKVWNLQRS